MTQFRTPVPVGDVSGDGIADIAFVGRSDVDVEIVLGATTFDPANSEDASNHSKGFRQGDKPLGGGCERRGQEMSMVTGWTTLSSEIQTTSPTGRSERSR